MQQSIFDRTGQCVGWLRTDVVYDREAKCRAFIKEGQIFSFNGRHIGQLLDGFIRTKAGLAVAFTHQAAGAPRVPETVTTPTTPIFQIPPRRPNAAVTAVPALPESAWAAVTWAKFLVG